MAPPGPRPGTSATDPGLRRAGRPGRGAACAQFASRPVRCPLPATALSPYRRCEVTSTTNHHTGARANRAERVAGRTGPRHRPSEPDRV